MPQTAARLTMFTSARSHFSFSLLWQIIKGSGAFSKSHVRPDAWITLFATSRNGRAFSVPSFRMSLPQSWAWPLLPHIRKRSIHHREFVRRVPIRGTFFQPAARDVKERFLGIPPLSYEHSFDHLVERFTGI
jgi:hypothetical protein